MRLVIHPAVYSDLLQIVEYYENAAGTELAADFYDELFHLIRTAARTPERYPIRDNNLRQANLTRFPYHFLFRVNDTAVQILVLRHHRRDPSYGLERR